MSEEDGGGSISGGGVTDLALVAYQFGRYAAPAPLLPANVVADDRHLVLGGATTG